MNCIFFLSGQDLEALLSRLEGDRTVVQTMKSQLGAMKDLEQENKTLRKENAYCKYVKPDTELTVNEIS